MQIEYKDPRAREECEGKIDKIVVIVHTRLGSASSVFISDIPGKGLKLETETEKSIVVDYDLTKLLEEES